MNVNSNQPKQTFPCSHLLYTTITQRNLNINPRITFQFLSLLLKNGDIPLAEQPSFSTPAFIPHLPSCCCRSDLLRWTLQGFLWSFFLLLLLLLFILMNDCVLKVGDGCSSNGDCGPGLYCFSCPPTFFASRCVRSLYTDPFKLLVCIFLALLLEYSCWVSLQPW